MRTVAVLLACAVALAIGQASDGVHAYVPTYQCQVINAAPPGQQDAQGAWGSSRFDASIPDPGATAPRQQCRSADFEALTSPRDWGGDIFIGQVATMQGGRMSLDHAENGDLYVAQLVVNTAPQCSVDIFKSTDAGMTWTQWGSIRNAVGDDTLQDAVLRVGPGANPFLFILCHYATSAGALKLWRCRVDGSEESFNNIIRGDSVIGQIDLDRNIESPYSLFMTYVEVDGSTNLLRLFASYDSGLTWTGGRSVRSGDQRTPRTCAGAGGYVYLTWAEMDSIIWVGRYTNNLVSPSFTFTLVDTSGHEPGYVPSVAASRMGTGTSQVAWLLNRHHHIPADAYDTHVSWSTDGGVSWQTSYWSACGGIVHSPEDFRAPFVRCSYDYGTDLVAGVATLYTSPLESLVHAWAPASDPNSWTRDVINEQPVTGQHSAGLDITLGTSGSIVTWRQYGSGNLWADLWYNPTGVEQGRPAPAGLALAAAPNPARGAVRIAYVVPAAGPVSVTVHDIAGREVARLANSSAVAGHYAVTWNCGSMPAGIYICRLNAGGRTMARRIVVTE